MSEWYCIYTKPKQEELVCHRLGELADMEVFNPKLKRTKSIRSKMVEVVEELFPSYVFLRFGAPGYFHMIQYTRGVKRFVGNSLGIPYVVDDSVIEQIKSRMDNGFVQTGGSPFNRGQKVLINGGPFKGFSGIFLNETKPSDRIMILLSMIASEIRMEIGREKVVPA